MSKKSNIFHSKERNDLNLDKFPDVSADLIEVLDTLFPEKSADLTWSDKEVWYKSGQRSVINFLIDRLKQQEETII